MSKITFVPALVAVLGTAGIAFAAFNDVDTDQDGYLSAEEFVVAFPDASEEIFTTADVNADGMISSEEHVAAIDAGLLPAE